MRSESAASLACVAAQLVRHPVRHLLRRWNYKSALTSSIIRGALFFLTNLSSGVAAASAAWLTEFILRFATSGFYGALTQAFSRVTPDRTGTLAALIVLPLLAHSLEIAVHLWLGTPNVVLSVVVSVGLTIVSTSFNVFAMRRGVLIVGEANSRSLMADLKAIPRVVVAFVAMPLQELIRLRPSRAGRSQSASARP